MNPILMLVAMPRAMRLAMPHAWGDASPFRNARTDERTNGRDASKTYEQRLRFLNAHGRVQISADSKLEAGRYAPASDLLDGRNLPWDFITRQSDTPPQEVRQALTALRTPATSEETTDE